MFKKQIDMRSEPVHRMVALGESTAWGYSVSLKEKCWVSQLGGMLEEFQGEKIEVINQGIGSNVLTPQCPSYERSAKPSALERVDEEVIALNPDLLLISYGINDSCGGTNVQVFHKEYQKLIDRIREKINPLIVVINTYYILEDMYKLKGWAESDYNETEVYNTIWSSNSWLRITISSLRMSIPLKSVRTGLLTTTMSIRMISDTGLLQTRFLKRSSGTAAL